MHEENRAEEKETKVAKARKARVTQDPGPSQPFGVPFFRHDHGQEREQATFFQDERPDDLLRFPIRKVCKHSMQQGTRLCRLRNLRQSLQLLRLPRVQSDLIELSASTDTEPRPRKFTGFSADFAASSTTICRNEARDSSQGIVVLS